VPKRTTRLVRTPTEERWKCLAPFHEARAPWSKRRWENDARAALSWGPISRGESTLLLAPTGSGKTLAAFLWAIDTLM